tara:strand:+ start:534 stop:1697 length:1164 start_codon:yes stop_codon:yes gene_type:complete
MKKIVIFGSTGSIGSSLVNIIKKNKKNFEVKLLTANRNYKKIIKQCKILNVRNIIITDKKSFLTTKKILKNSKINIYNNFNSLNKIFKNKEIDYTMSAISGFDGLKPTLNIIKFTKIIAIANKESIICGWCLIKKYLTRHNTKFIPIDSEHFSIWSLINKTKLESIEKIFITASGGPFINHPLNKFKSITKKNALNHPNWKMGKKITIDSATMMNKVFEIIEAKKIFNLKYDKLSILTHPKSYVHAIVQFRNGLTKILIHDTDMTIPIFNSLFPNFEKYIKSKKLNLSIMNNLNFRDVDKSRFPVIKIINNLSNKDSLYETIIVTINDHLVNLFLEDKIKFIDISKNLLKLINLQEFKKYKKILPKNVAQIEQLNKYVSLKMSSLSI